MRCKIFSSLRDQNNDQGQSLAIKHREWEKKDENDGTNIEGIENVTLERDGTTRWTHSPTKAQKKTPKKGWLLEIP